MGHNLDFFPADVTVDGVRHEKARVTVLGDRAFVFVTEFGQPKIAAQGTVTDTWQPSGLPWHVALADGGTWTVTQSQGCGCGHPMKRHRGPHLVALLAPTPQPVEQ